MNEKVMQAMDKETLDCIERLSTLKHGSEEYEAALKELDNLLTIKTKHRPIGRFEKFISNAPLLNLFGDMMKMGMLLNYEKVDVVTSKALNYIKSKS